MTMGGCVALTMIWLLVIPGVRLGKRGALAARARGRVAEVIAPLASSVRLKVPPAGCGNPGPAVPGGRLERAAELGAVGSGQVDDTAGRGDLLAAHRAAAKHPSRRPRPSEPETSISEPGRSSMKPRAVDRLTVPPGRTSPVCCPRLLGKICGTPAASSTAWLPSQIAWVLL